MSNFVKRLFAIILLAAALLPWISTTTEAAQTSSSLTLREPDDSQMVAFHVPNMFPGQSVTKDYVIETRHSAPIVLNYHADVRPDERYQKLAEVLKIRILLLEDNVQLYEGLMADMPGAVSHRLPAGRNQTTYRITVSLDTSVGNEYMDKELVADFRWWFLDQYGNSVTIVAEKLMNGNYARGSKFTFQMKDEAGNVVSTVKNKDGHIEFDTLYFAEPGTYVYTLSEVKGRDSELFYDPAVYKATITVAEDGSCRIAWQRNGRDYGYEVPRFMNATKDYLVPDDPSEEDPENPKTGDPFPLQLMIMICLSSLCALICLLLLWKGRRKEDRDEQE